MATGSTRTRRPATQRRAVTAAAQRISLTTRDGRKLLRRSPQKWQDEAWAYFGVLPEVSFSASFLGNAMSRVRWYPAIQTDPNEAAVPLDDLPEDETGKLPTGLIEDAYASLERLSDGSDGLPGIKRAFGINLSVVGEAYLVGREPEDPLDPRDETWGVYSSAALSEKGGSVVLQDEPNGPKIELPDDTLVYRVWRRDPQWPGLAWSNMKAALDTAEEMLLFGRRLRSQAKSGTNAGILLVPEEIDPPAQPRANPDNTDESDPDAVGEGDGLTQLERDIYDALTSAVEDDGSPNAVAPFVLRAAYQYIDRIRHLQFAAAFDSQIVERLNHLVRRLAHGLDLPPEFLEGLGGSNHWTAWLVDDNLYRSHVEPLDATAAYGVASAYLRPELVDKGYPVEVVRRLSIGLDPSDLVTRPNRSADYKDGHDRRVISDAAYRDAIGATDADAPSDEELARRWVLSRGPATAKMTKAIMEATGLVAPGALPENVFAGAREGDGEELPAGDESSGELPAGDDGTPGEGGGDPLPSTLARAITAASRPNPYARLGDDLAAIESRLRERLVVAASAAVDAALRKAGSRLRSQAQGVPELRGLVNGQPPEEVGQILGEETAAALADPDTLLAGSFDQLGDQWDTWVSQAQAEIATKIEQAAADAPSPELAAAALAEYRRDAEEQRTAGWVVFAAAVLTLARGRLFSDADDLVSEGELSTSVLVPHGPVRDALARVGGTPVGADGEAVTAPGAAPASLITGPIVGILLAALSARVMGWRWETGMPEHPFAPHQRLAGTEFTNWDDPRLANTGSFPRVAYLRPGDHKGCQCMAVPALAPNVSQQEALAA